MALYYNSNNVPQSNKCITTVMPATRFITITTLFGKSRKLSIPAYQLRIQNLGYAAFFTVTNSGSDIKVDAFGGTERGYGRVMLGGFSTIGYSQIYFANLRAFITNSFSHIKVALSDINGNVVQQLIYSEANGFDTTYTASTKFNINSPNGNYYLMLEVESGATHLGKNATILMNGCYLI